MEVITDSSEKTKKLGKKVANILIKKHGKNSKPIVLGLVGDLGSGKTTFVQGFATALGITKRIVSPTFIILRSYDTKDVKCYKNLYHIDLYRLEENIDKELANLGIDEIWSDTENIVVIEWAEKIDNMLPTGSIIINFSVINEKKRMIIIDGMEETITL
jgi:tRNA threonylcarbamoyladenosine biosynthesis protein TsaE